MLWRSWNKSENNKNIDKTAISYAILAVLVRLELLFAIYFRIICCYNEKNGRVNFVDVWFAGNCVWERINVWIV